MHLQISSLNRVYFGQTKYEISRFSTGNVKFTIILLSFSKVIVTVSANLASFLSNMTHNLVLFFVERVNCLDKKFSQEFHFLTLKGHGKFGPKLNPAFPNQPPKNWSICFQRAIMVQISYFIALFCLKVNCFNQTFSQEFYFVILEGHETFGPKLNPTFQMSPKKISQFAWSRRKGSNFKFYCSLLSETYSSSTKNLHRGFILSY